MSGSTVSQISLLRSAGLGLLFCIFQIFLTVLIAPKKEGWGGAYLRLNQWDSHHYIDIARRGYQLPPGTLKPEDVHSNRANVGYFPAYALVTASAASCFSIPVNIATLLVAQIFCFLFWFHCFLGLDSLKVSRRSELTFAAVLLSYPASYFLVAGYSESLFAASLMGFIFWTDRWSDLRNGRQTDDRKARSKQESLNLSCFLMCVFGILMTSSRLVGLPLVIYPLLQWLSFQPITKDLKSILFNPLIVAPMFLGATASLGGLGFFAWCYFKFGYWDLYFRLQHLGFGNVPNFFAVFYPSSYLPKLFFEDTTTSVCKVSNLFILGLSVWAYRLVGKKQLPLYILGLIMFLISLAGKANYSMDSMVRYNLPVFVILCYVLLDAIGEEGMKNLLQIRRNKVLFWLGTLIALVFQIWMIRVFTKGGWVA